MSHLVVVDVVVKDPVALDEAAARVGLVAVETQEFDWYGRWVNDYHGKDAAYKHGVATREYGRCAFALVQRDSLLGKAELEARQQGRRLTHEEATKIRRTAGAKGDSPYSIGVVADVERPGEYRLAYDFWADGKGLKAKVGENCDKLRQAYGVAVARRTAAFAGHEVLAERSLPDGRVQLKVRMRR